MFKGIKIKIINNNIQTPWSISRTVRREIDGQTYLPY